MSRLLQWNQIRTMKLVEFTKYPSGAYLDIVKIPRVSIVSLSFEKKSFRNIIPCFLFQIGGDAGLIISLDVFQNIFTFTFLDQHYDF